jgi:Ala-tRNA(Pro) deacylase
MTTLRSCIQMLERHGIPYLHTRHSNAYRAREVADAEHLPPYMLAKTVILRGPDGFAMAVLPADCVVNLEDLAAALNMDRLRLATEEEVRERIPNSEIGATPPFGDLCGLPVYMDISLAKQAHIFFNAGTHRDAIHMSVVDYIRLADPILVRFARPDALGSAPARSKTGLTTQPLQHAR